MGPLRWLWFLTIANLGLLGWQVAGLARGGSDRASEGVLRGRGLELLDAQGRLRVQLKVEPGDPAYRWPDGSRVGYPETVLFRLITADGKPRVKLTASEEGTGLMLLGSTDETRSVLVAERTEPALTLRRDGATQRVIGP
jgi:hypothetical protein